MRIPSFLIKLYQRIKHTRVWRHKWKIVAVAPFILALGVFAFYTIYRTVAENQHRDFVASWEAKGESLDIDSLYPTPGDEKDDFFTHPDVVSEVNRTHTIRLGRIDSLEIVGITENLNHYSSVGKKGTYAMGVPADIRLWLEPPLLTQPDQVAAEKCLQLISPFNARLDAISEASLRPEAFHARGFDSTGNISHSSASMSSLHLAGTAQLFSSRVILRIVAGDEEGATQDMMCLLRITDHFRAGDSLIGYLVGAAIIQTLEHPLWEGLRRHRWSDASLVKFDKKLSKMNEHKRFLRCIRQEMAYLNLIYQSIHKDPEFLEKQLKGFFPSSGSTATKTWKERGQEVLEDIKPRGWYLKKGTQELAILSEELFYPNGQQCTELAIAQAKNLERIPNPMHDPIFDSLLTGNETMELYARQIGKALKTQASIHNMRTAIALERHHIKYGKYPLTLGELVPSFLPELLDDVITGEPLHYRIKADGTPLIYSIGANEKDDGGIPRRKIEKGDWAWMYSPPTGFTFDDFRKQ